MSRRELAEAVARWLWDNTGTRYDLDVHLVAKWERGEVRWPTAHYRAALRAVLGVATDRDLGFRQPRRCVATLDDVDRKNFLQLALGAGASVAVGRSLTELVAASEPTPIPSAVALTDIEEIRTAAGVFRNWDHTYGGGLVREAVAAQLRYSAELLNARCPEKLRGELYSAVGFLGHASAFMAFDAYAHNDARRMFRFARACAEHAGDWHLRAGVLASMARQSFWCGDFDASLTFVEFAQVRSDRLTATERAVLAALRARALAKVGRVEDAVRAVGDADEEFAHSNPADDPPYVHYFDAAEQAGETGHALADLAVRGRFASEASGRLRAAVSGHRAVDARSRAFCQIRLASMIMVVSDPDEAAVIGTDALSVASTIRSRRLNNHLRDLRQASERHTGTAQVAELCGRIDAIVRGSP
jgi:hypothetical protein